jgi:hypothetical protein
MPMRMKLLRKSIAVIRCDKSSGNARLTASAGSIKQASQ